ncbi:5564_t:CDS:2 [Dentiscutata heterogama]|uniref:5564_t:CDS:1 n=1 Tax=Dentiscutata heterogama TaxID=1316150 RepID=A0ACA9KZ97_9GLOM|nr:5564_t:CDS:2 [Dentiscutata heterogama]
MNTEDTIANEPIVDGLKDDTATTTESKEDNFNQKFSKKQKKNYRPKESDLNEKEYKQAQIHNSNGKYIALKKSFEHEEIAVDAIKDLPNNYLDKLGVHKIG